MKPHKKDSVKINKLVLNGLYKQAYLLETVPPAILSGWQVDELRAQRMVKVDNDTLATSPTYVMHKKNFQNFTKALKSLCVQYDEANKSKNPQQGYSRIEKTHAKFVGDYKAALDSLVYVRQHAGQVYLNMDLLPRDKAGMELFWEFMRLYSRLMVITRLSMAGAPRQTRALKLKEQIQINTDNSKGKSRSIMAGKIAEMRGYSLKTEGKKLPSLKQSIKRHLRR